MKSKINWQGDAEVSSRNVNSTNRFACSVFIVKLFCQEGQLDYVTLQSKKEVLLCLPMAMEKHRVWLDILMPRWSCSAEALYSQTPLGNKAWTVQCWMCPNSQLRKRDPNKQLSFSSHQYKWSLPHLPTKFPFHRFMHRSLRAPVAFSPRVWTLQKKKQYLTKWSLCWREQ